MSLAPAFHQFVLAHKEQDLHVCLRGAPPWLGRVTVETVMHSPTPVPGDSYGRTVELYVYRIESEVQMGANGRPMKMPFHFGADDVLWWSCGPEAIDRPRIDLAGAGWSPT